MKNYILPLYHLSSIFYKLIVINLLILFFSLIGLIVIGFFPAMVAGFSVLRDWIILKKEPPIFRSFFQYFKIHLIKGNLLGYLFTSLFIFFYLDFYFFQSLGHIAWTLLSFLYIPLMILTILTFLYIFPIYVHYDLKIKVVIKNAFLLAIGNPFTTILIIFLSAVLLVIFYFIPTIFIFIGFSSIIYIISMFSHTIFQKLETAQGVTS